MRKAWLLVVLGFAAGLCGCGPGGTAALLLLLLPHKESKQKFVTLTVRSGYGEPEPPAGTHRYRKGSTITVSCGATPYPSANPAGGTRFVCTGWTAVGSDLTSGVEQSFTFTISGDTAINWLWRTEHRLTVKGEPLGAGTVSVSPSSGDDYYAEGAGVTLEAQPAAGYSFAYWKGDATGTDNPLTLTMNAPKEVVAVFVPQLQITTVTLPEGEVGIAYPATTLTATGGVPPYTWRDVNKTLQSYGLTLDPSTGEITGTPTQATPTGGVTVTIAVTDSSNNTAQKDFTLIIYSELQITTTSLPDGYEGQAGYNATLAATGGTGSYSWSIVSGSLPSGLNFDSSGVISGDIATGTAGTYSFAVEVTDGRETAQANLTIIVYPPLQITTTSLPDGYEGQTGYTATLTATGGNSANYVWSMSGALPFNLSWDAATATISGDIAAGKAGDYPLQFQVTDGIQTATANLTLTVREPLRITTTCLPDAYEGISYSYAVQAVGGNTAKYNWSVNGQPSWLSINSSTGELSGTPPTGSAGTYTFTVQVTDGLQTAQADLSITVLEELQITTTSLPDGYEGQTGYSATLTATGGTGTYTWSIVSGSLPPNLALDSFTGVISGDIDSTASSSSPYNFTVEVTDGLQTVQANLSITVYAQLQITTTSLPDGYEGQTGYTATLTATGGTGTYTWSLTGGTLPSGLSWDAATATISGDIAAGTAGDYALQFEVTDGLQTVTADLTLTVYAELLITTTSLPAGYDGQTGYSETLTATGGSGSYSWSVVSGSLPPGLALEASTGVIGGDIATGIAGTYNFAVEVTDGQETVRALLSIIVYPQLQITTTSLPAGYEGQTGYSAQLAATGGTGTYTWSMTGGTLPSGLSWDAATATISGDIAAGKAGDYPLQFEVTDGLQTVTADLTLTVYAELLITTTSLPAGYDGQTGYSETLTATGGTGSYSWSIVSGDLPPNLTLDSSGVISGDIASNASSSSPYNFTVEVTDGQQTVQANFSVTVYAQLQITTTTLPEGYEGQTGYSAQLAATGGTGTYTWSMTGGTLPSGLSWDAATATISGNIASNASANSPYNISVEVTDGQQTVQANFSITVWQQLQITTTSLPDGYEGQTGYSVTLTATGGAGTYTWSMTGGNLPANLSWDATSATISGDIAAGTAGDYTLQFEVTDGIQTVAATLTLTVREPLQITTTSLPDAAEAVAYSFAVQATGGNPSNYTWSISGQPSWLSIDSSTGELSGTPPAGSAGTYNFTVEVTDGQQTVSKQFDLTVNEPLKADFEADPTEGTAPLTVNFTDKSTGNPTSWEWDFDNDGTVDSTQQNPRWTYNDPGWYTVKLTVSKGTSSDTCVKEKYIQVGVNVYYVDGVNGDDTNGGTGWSDAWKTVAKALSVAGDNDLVLVADATYNETDLNFNGKKIYLKGVDHNTSGAQPVIDCQGNGRAFYFGSGETADSVIDNFVIQNGKVEDTCAGAILCENNSSPTITNCVFRNNEAADTNGWWDNEHGGAIYCYDSSPTITNCTFSGNNAGDDGGAIYCDSSSPSITNCTFSGNSANMWYGGAISCLKSSSPTITDCTFSGNSANRHGGAIFCNVNSPTVNNCTFSDNSAGNEGGAICCDWSTSPTVTNCTFSGNSADDGGAIYCYSNSSPTITNCTFSDNDANEGGAIHCYRDSSVTLNNCILWGNSASSSGDEIYIYDDPSYPSYATLNYCCVDNTGYGGKTGNIKEYRCIHKDPQFVDAANGDYHLKDTSPCIDAGDNSLVPSGVTTDLDGNQRIVDGDNDSTATVDIGAYEKQ